jgi:hypothetical protein
MYYRTIDDMEYVFKGSPSCIAIEYNLHDYLTALCILYALGILVCLCVITALVFIKCWQEEGDQSDTTQVTRSLLYIDALTNKISSLRLCNRRWR